MDITSARSSILAVPGNKKGDRWVALVWLYAARDLARTSPYEGNGLAESAHAREGPGARRGPHDARRFGVGRLDESVGHHCREFSGHGG